MGDSTVDVEQAPLQIVVEVWRAKDASRQNPSTDAMYEPQEYIRRFDGGALATGRFDWRADLYQALAVPWQQARLDRPLLEFVAGEASDLLFSLRWEEDKQHIEQALAKGRRVILTFRFGAAELYALPWELVTLGGKALGVHPDIHIHYEWPGSVTAPRKPDPPEEGGRILVAWSQAGGDVPHEAVIGRIQQVAAEGYLAFDPQRDVVPHASIAMLERALALSPVAILHLVCHAKDISSRIPAHGCWLDADDATPGGFVADSSTLRRLLAPHASCLRAVIVSVCRRDDATLPGTSLGPLATEIHRAGIPVVVASRWPLTPVGVVDSAAALYQQLVLEGSSVQKSFVMTRSILQRARPDVSDWASISCWARRDDGFDTRPIVARPYRGLLPFRKEQARFFFGRDAEIEEAVLDLTKLIEGKGSALRPRFLLVMGASGTGKSSLVLGGVVPALKRKDATWRVSILRPSTHWSEDLANLHSTQGPISTRHLVVVDQLEEIFTHLTDKRERTLFMRALFTLASDPDAPISIIATFRVDFLARCNEIEVDASGRTLEAIAYDEAQRVFVRKMDSRGLATIITLPAVTNGFVLETGLAERMIADLGDEPGALPLLEYTLDLLWLGRSGNMFTSRTYESLGGAVGALSGRADAVYAQFDVEEKLIAKSIFLRLTSFTRGALETRRRARLSELYVARMDRTKVDRVLAVLSGTDARLIVVDDDHVEVAHEALIDGWKTLRGWIEESRDLMPLQRRISEVSAAWYEAGRKDDFLFDGTELLSVRRAWPMLRDELNDIENQFVRGSWDRFMQAGRGRFFAGFVIIGFGTLAANFFLGTLFHDNASFGAMQFAGAPVGFGLGGLLMQRYTRRPLFEFGGATVLTIVLSVLCVAWYFQLNTYRDPLDYPFFLY